MSHWLDFLSFLFMMVAASLSLYLTIGLKGKDRQLLYLALSLTLFAVVHGLYHLADFEDLAVGELLLRPLSVLLLIIFGVYLVRSGI